MDAYKLPDQFVLKCTHDSGSVVFCKDKATFDKEAARQKLNQGLATKQFYLSREWPYKNVVPRIICEMLLVDGQSDDITDYKFMCFSSKVKMIMVITERHSSTGAKANCYDKYWTLLSVRDASFPNNPKPDIKPGKLNEMIHLAEILSAGMPHVRVDLYYLENRIYFGEMTFFDSGERKFFYPYEFNIQMGEWLQLPEKMK